MSDALDMRLILCNRPENVALVRQALSGLANVVGIEAGLLADIKTAVSEACNNVVLHAYADASGPLEVYACPDGNEVEVVVRDHGHGIQPRQPDSESGMQGVGLSLIQALTERVEFGGGIGEGTEVRMRFRSEHPLRAVVGAGNGNGAQPPSGDTLVSASGELVGPVLGAVIAVLAARAGFSLERLSDAQLVTDAIGARPPGTFVGNQVHAGIESGRKRLELRVGPLVAGGADELVRSSSVGGLRPVLEQLTDELEVTPAGDHEELRLVISDGAGEALKNGPGAR